ncbi:hypothetical protein JOF36_004210 [Pseudonocardia parietis]|uniref:CsbD-like domain-containing protein n=1 Tax=Pseudonocardia parietis TaxID=570936 RepID=A0ABS4VYH7_9PSEU|nr:hypothetical protein [Pseudonocardia parietis]
MGQEPRERRDDSSERPPPMSPKETIGRLSGNEKLETEGKTEQRKSKLKQAGNQAKDAFKK